MSNAQDTQHPPQGQATSNSITPYRPHLIPIPMSQANSNTASSTTLAEEDPAYPFSRPASERNSNTSGSDRVVFTTGFGIFQASRSSSSHSSYAQPLINERNNILTTINDMENATLRLLLNLATEQPALFRIEGRELEWLRSRAGELGYRLDADPALSSTEPQPRAPSNTVSSSASNSHVPSHDSRSAVDVSAHAIHRPPTPMPGRRSDEPPSSESISSGSGSNPDPNTVSTLPNLPGLFHDWLTNPVDQARVISAITACSNERVRSYAYRYLEVTAGIRRQRAILRELDDKADECQRLLGALDWDRRSIAATLIGLRAESHLYPNVVPPERPESSNIIPTSHSSHHTSSSSSHNHRQSRTSQSLPQSIRVLTPSPPDGSSGYAFPGGMGSRLQVPQSRLHHDHSDNDSADYHGDRSQNTSAQAIRGSSSQRPEPTTSARRHSRERCWECGSHNHVKKNCRVAKRRRESRRKIRHLEEDIHRMLAN